MFFKFNERKRWNQFCLIDSERRYVKASAGPPENITLFVLNTCPIPPPIPIREHINNRIYKKRKRKKKNKKDKTKKSLRKNVNLKERKKANKSDQDSQNEDKRNSGFLSKEEFIKKNIW